MNYAEIKYCDIANGPGVRTSLFVSGCRHRCPGCFSALTWDFAVGQPFDDGVQSEILKSLEANYIAGLTVLGGDPLEPENQAVVASFLERVRAINPDKSIWLYTGFTWEEIVDGPSRAHTADALRILGSLDVLVDGPFVLDEKDITLRFRGSANQRLIDVPASLTAGTPVIWEDDPAFATHGWASNTDETLEPTCATARRATYAPYTASDISTT